MLSQEFLFLKGLEEEASGPVVSPNSTVKSAATPAL